MDLLIDAGWVTGMLLASIRIAAFVAASPIFGAAIPATGRIALVLVLGYTFADPVTVELTFGFLIVTAFTNAIVGFLLGYLTGVIFTLFTVAGGLIDFTSSLSAAQVFDPLTRSQNPIFGRFFNLSALALFFVLGGDRLLVAGMQTSFDAVGVTGELAVSSGLVDLGVTLLSRMMIAAVELAMPAMAALFVVEVLLGIASRFAPQANVFLIGIPAKIVTALASVTAVLLLVPETMDGSLNIIRDTFRDVMRYLT
ncbi:MAG: flagellar biosynthetic protein FliR [bacterium]|nr:flagellar biosynthetic protein FliR [bacterium]